MCERCNQGSQRRNGGLESRPMGFRGRSMSKCSFAAGMLAVCATCASTSGADTPSADTPSYGPELQGFAYPYPVAQFDFPSQRQTLHMAYMDVRPKIANGRTVALLHGKNFCAATWHGTIDVLAAAGYRVIAP